MSAVATITGNSRFTATLTQVLTQGTGTNLPISTQSLQASVNQNTTYLNAASGAINTTDLLYGQVHSIVNPTPLVINLGTGGALTDLFGQTITIWGRVRELIIQNTSTVSGHDLNVYASASGGWVVALPLVAEQLLIPAGGMLHLTDPLSFGGTDGLYVPASAGSFAIASAAGTVAVNIIIAGCSVT
jgi:hypothetical protein